MIVMKYSVKTGKNDDDFQIILFEIMKKNEWCWNLVTQNEITAVRITVTISAVDSKSWQMHESIDTRFNWKFIHLFYFQTTYLSYL